MLPVLNIAAYRFSLEAQGDFNLPPWKGSTLRGGLGSILKRLVCFQRPRSSCTKCLLKSNCPYAYLFEGLPPDKTEVLRGYSAIPLPFVIEPPLDERTSYSSGDKLEFNLLLVGKAIEYLPYFILAFRELGRVGLGRDKGKYLLREVIAYHPLNGEETAVYSAADENVTRREFCVGFGDVVEKAKLLPADRIVLRFLTPVRIKHRGRFVSRPDFHHIVRALLHRISALCYFHCGERWEFDFKGAIERAERVRTVRCETEWVDWERYSGRQKARLKMGGFVGEAEYEGELAEFRSLLLLGQLIHVGKACVFGNGKYEVANGGWANDE